MSTDPWWRNAAIYQIYIRSFGDDSGDGIGDLAGIRSRLPYLHDLGVDAIWVNPWYPSPMADGGYDIADYRDVDATFGNLQDAEQLISDAHRHELRVIIDLVPNHCSRNHPWFRAALAAEPGSIERERFWFRDGRGNRGELPPNGWPSVFGGPAWTRVIERDGSPGQWYLHLFDSSQPDFNWNHSQVRTEFTDILRFWLDRGIDGFRIDAADRLCKDAALPDLNGVAGSSPHTDLDDVHEIYRGWRRLVDSYSDARVLIGEIWVTEPERFIRYLRPDELHSAFNFDFLCSRWHATQLRDVIDDTLARHASVAAPPTWVLSNHDVTRHITRYGRSDSRFVINQPRGEPVPVDIAIGTRRARAALLLTMALPGCVYIYQGDELGLWEVEDLPETVLTDPVWHRSGRTDRGRDGCRVPLPWQGDAPSFGFSPPDAVGQPWLPQPAAWRTLAAQTQRHAPGSMSVLYRTALRIRREKLANLSNSIEWLQAPPDVFAFHRTCGFVCVVNFSATPVPLPLHQDVLLASVDIDGSLPGDTAVWLDAADEPGMKLNS